MKQTIKAMNFILKAALFHLLKILMQKKSHCFLKLFILKKMMTSMFLKLPCNIMMAMANNSFHL